jgi:hypothetical protein
VVVVIVAVAGVADAVALAVELIRVGDRAVVDVAAGPVGVNVVQRIPRAGVLRVEEAVAVLVGMEGARDRRGGVDHRRVAGRRVLEGAAHLADGDGVGRARGDDQGRDPGDVRRGLRGAAQRA